MNRDSIYNEKPFFLKEEILPIKENQVFIILPFKNIVIFEKVIKPTLLSDGLNCIKADDIFNTNALMQDIANSIRESSIIIADLTEKNANVFYELGLAHAFNKKVILITQNDSDVPSDLKGYKYYKYDINTTDGINNFEEILKKLKSSIDANLVFDSDEKVYEISSIHGNEQQISSKFLKQPEGTFIIWAYLEQNHIAPPKDRNEWTYIFSHATNRGNVKTEDDTDNNDINDIKNKNNKPKPYYPNSWAIGKVANTKEVFWRFTCNGSVLPKIDFRKNLKLEQEWNMFSVIWSKEKNFIKFYINDIIAGDSEFKYWPTELDDFAIIGTWPNRASSHFFNSKIGNYIIMKNVIKFEKLQDFYKNNKPK